MPTVFDRYNEVIYVHWRGAGLFLINDSQVVLEGRKRGQVKQVFREAQKEASTISTAGQEEISESCRGAAYDGGTLIGRLTYKHRLRCHSAVAEGTSYKQRPRVQGACARSLNSLDKEILSAVPLSCNESYSCKSKSPCCLCPCFVLEYGPRLAALPRGAG